MDPNTLDPKLKETYERVMATPTAAPQPVTNNTPQPQTNSAPANSVTNAPQTTEPVVPQDMPQAAPTTPAYTQDNLSFQAAIQTPVVGTPLAAPGAIIPPQHKTSPLLKVLYVIGAIVFFVAYTFLWIKIFNLPLPF